jgi:hypothetical protein
VPGVGRGLYEGVGFCGGPTPRRERAGKQSDYGSEERRELDRAEQPRSLKVARLLTGYPRSAMTACRAAVGPSKLDGLSGCLDGREIVPDASTERLVTSAVSPVGILLELEAGKRRAARTHRV